ncbi:MAG: glycoside hydrolase family 1 protein [Myxococcota bacterium]
MIPESRTFPEDFLWGASTSSHQVEGDNTANDWWAWEHQRPELIRGGRLSGAAAEWWSHRAEHDLDLAVDLGHNAHRLSLEWSRLEPEPGVVSSRALDRYRQILDHASRRGLKVFVNINHFTLPGWFAERGGWLSPEAIPRFRAYARMCALELGDLVSAFLTINEPSVLAYKGYLQGMWPPGARNLRLAGRCLARQLDGHGAAYVEIKRNRPDVPVGIAINVPSFDPSRPGRIRDRLSSGMLDWLINGALLYELRNGRRAPPFGLGLSSARRMLDFVGLNFYGMYEVRHEWGGRPRLVQRPTIATETADWGRPSAERFERVLLRLAQLKIPILVTENGLFDPDDAQRPQYIVDHVAAVHRVLQKGVDVLGYCHWSLIDNFEWAQGWTAPFGLIGLDPRDQSRTIKRSAQVLQSIARSNALPEPGWDPR